VGPSGFRWSGLERKQEEEEEDRERERERLIPKEPAESDRPVVKETRLMSCSRACACLSISRLLAALRIVSVILLRGDQTAVTSARVAEVRRERGATGNVTELSYRKSAT
jgi:hypothetical protein